MEGGGRSEEESVSGVGDDVEVYGLAYDLHHVEIVGRDGQDDDAVLVVVSRLHLRKVGPNLVVDGGGGGGQEDGTLYAAAPFLLEIAADEPSDLVALYVIHYEK